MPYQPHICQCNSVKLYYNILPESQLLALSLLLHPETALVGDPQDIRSSKTNNSQSNPQATLHAELSPAPMHSQALRQQPQGVSQRD